MLFPTPCSGCHSKNTQLNGLYKLTFWSISAMYAYQRWRGSILGSLRCPRLVVFLLQRATCTWTVIFLTAPNWFQVRDILRLGSLFCNFYSILFDHMYIAPLVEGRHKKCVFLSSSVSFVLVFGIYTTVTRCYDMATSSFAEEKHLQLNPFSCLRNVETKVL